MKFNELRQEIKGSTNLGFVNASAHLEEVIFGLRKADVMELITEIGTIPEDIGHDSTEEKLYTKASDILFCKSSFRDEFCCSSVEGKS